MLSKRKFVLVLCGSIATMTFVAAPYRVVSGKQSLELHLQAALAKNGNNGGRGGAGSGGNNGSGNGQGNARGAEGNAKRDRAGRDNGGSVESGESLEVHHPDGMSEKIQNGRYVMKDARGRTIINRSANPSDQSRLRSFIH